MLHRANAGQSQGYARRIISGNIKTNIISGERWFVSPRIALANVPTYHLVSDNAEASQVSTREDESQEDSDDDSGGQAAAALTSVSAILDGPAPRGIEIKAVDIAMKGPSCAFDDLIG